MHIGLIGGIGPAATEFYYRGLVARHAASGTHLELTIDHADLRELAKNIDNGDPKRQADIFVRHLRRLAAAGAKAAAITSIGGHFCIREAKAASPVRLVNAIPEIDAEIRRQGLKRVGILGTQAAMRSKLYGLIEAAEIVAPQGTAQDIVHENYLQMAIDGRATDDQRRALFSIGQELCVEGGAEAVLLGGTDFFLAFDGWDPGFPVIDCATVHVDALYLTSLGLS
jgi:aspartate racemase